MGAIEEGCVLESLNLGSIFKLPIVFILEDNGLAIHTKKDVRSSVTSYSDLAKTFNIKTFSGTFLKIQIICTLPLKTLINMLGRKITCFP